MERATAIVERITKLYDASAPEVVQAHNIFLQAMVELAEQNPTPTSMTEIEEWYDAHVVGNSIKPNAETFIPLLRASINFLEGEQMTTSVRKYLAMARDCSPDVIPGINDSGEFSDSEWDTLIRCQPDDYKEPPPLSQQDFKLSTPAGYASLIEHGLLPDPTLNIKPQKQKGKGLETLKNSLAIFEPNKHVAYPHEMEGTKEEKDLAYAYMRQVQLETDSINAALERWKADEEKLQEMGIHGVLKSKPVQALMWNWYSALVPQLKKEFELTNAVLSKPSKDNMRDDRHVYGTYLEQSSPETIAALTVSRVLQSCAQRAHDGAANVVKISQITSAIGRDIEDDINQGFKRRRALLLKKQRKHSRKALISTLARRPQETEQIPQRARAQNHTLDSFPREAFPNTVKTRLGALALECFLQSATITLTTEDPKTGKRLSSTQPAFRHQNDFIQGKRVGYIEGHHEVMAKLRNEPVNGVVTTKLPMVFEPKLWSSFDDGGYYTQRDSVVRAKGTDPSQRAYAESAIANGDMDKVLKGLDVLGKVPWQINGEVFKVMAEAWNAGEDIAGMVPEESKLERPPEPGPDATTEERFKWSKKVKAYENAVAGYHSQRCFQNFQLEIARAFLNEKKIYFPHSVDFRGRAYPVPPLLNHIGADFARGLLKFANGKELGTVGLQWLKVHLANLYGYDKASLREREQFSMDHLSDIYDSATNPLSGRRWWTKAEDPWQCLACCIELKNALDSPDPTRFLSQLPVHQDGTCNGLQHYAALGGDHAGASQVNLEPADRPQDIYTGVADLVKGMVAKDAANGDVMARFVDGKITRRVVKRTVMTNVYGVTFMGAKLQVWDELKDIFPDFEETSEIRNLEQPALYIAHKIFAALGRIFNGAQEIQTWLGECGQRITTSLSREQIDKIRGHIEGKPIAYDSKYKTPRKISSAYHKKLLQSIESFKTSIIWTTPLRMPVVQPYRKDDLVHVKTKIQSITTAKSSANHVVDKRKQLQAFPPNFIHSLDASHMLLSALKCSEMGLDFAAVHDSFWTHAADIPNLSIILRDTFVRMHSEDIIGRLAAEFKTRYAGAMYRARIARSSPVGAKIVQWRINQLSSRTYTAMATASMKEVALEAKRLELLNSEDAEKRKEGEAMVTPTSIWLANQDPDSIKSDRVPLLGEANGRRSKKSDKLHQKVLAAETDAIKDELEASGIEPADLEGDIDNAALEETDADALETEDIAEAADGPARKTKSFAGSNAIHVWLPLTFPPVPEKGSWDVNRLRDSKYFFS